MWGRHVHEAVLKSGTRVTGPTVHFVDEVYDEGSILAQWPVPVLVGDTVETLAARVLEAEHALYPRAAEHLCRSLLAGRAPLPLDPSEPHFMSASAPPSSPETDLPHT
jgi:folate-dependent phosphoribosylglycinamide formyltransferase PurN